MTQPSLNEAREWSGRWWLPEDPANKVAGVLRYDPDQGLALTLIGGWEYRVSQQVAPGVRSYSGQNQRWPVVHGTAEGKYLTLIETYVRAAKTFFTSQMSSNGPHELKLGAHVALVGCLLASPDERAFEAAEATVENLTMWSRLGGITIQLDEDEATKKKTGAITIEPVEALEAKAGDLTARLSLRASAPRDSYDRLGTNVGVEERAIFRFDSPTSREVSYWVDLLSTVEDLISLSTLRACGLITMRLWMTPRDDEAPAGHALHGRLKEVQVYQERIVKPDPRAKGLNQRDFVLTLDDVSFPVLAARWLEVHNTFSAARSMILGLQYVTDGYLESKVVTAVAAAESMSRAMKQPPLLARSELRDVRRAARDAVDERWQGWVTEKLLSAEPTLKDRLLFLLDRPGEFAKALIPNPVAWAESAANARNKLAHVGEAAHSADELFAVVQVTTAVVVLNFLHELGVPEDRMKIALADHRQLRWAVSLAREMYPA